MNNIPADVQKWLAQPDALLADMTAGSLGYVGFDLPEDLLAAVGRQVFHLPWRTGRSTPFADRWLESSFPPACRSILEEWHKGAFDHLDAVIFSRGDDAVQRLWYYVCELKRRGQLGGPRALVFDVARAERSTSRQYTINSVRRLADQLDLTRDDLSGGIVIANQRRELLTRLSSQRRGEGETYERLARATLTPGFETWASAFERAPCERPGVLIVGSSPPDARIHQAVASAGWNVVGEHHDGDLRRLGPVIADVSGDPADVIGLASNALSVGPREFGGTSDDISQWVSSSGAKAVVVWMIEQDEARAWRVPGYKRVLEEAKTPHLMLTRRAWTFDDGAAEAMIDFLENST